MIDLREVRSVTEFQRNIKDYVGRLKKNKSPLVLTVNGRAELVVQDARLDEVVEAITTAAHSGKIGDGKIFIFDVAEAIRIRNSDRGESAI